MLFTSPLFLFIFLPAVITLYAALPMRVRNSFICLASLIFYVWGEATYSLVLILSCFVNYYGALLIERSRRTWLFVLLIVVNLGALALFKYSEIITIPLNLLLAEVKRGPVAWTPHLPAGISFFTFHALSYIIDVWRGDIKAARKPVDFLLYYTLFPHLIAGPIVRYSEIQSQMGQRKWDWGETFLGMRRFVTGLAKKVLIANSLGYTVDSIYRNAHAELTPSLAWLAIGAYTLQIYFDFSGYTDMAIGMARVFGFQFPDNFAYPYSARSIREYWRRWHMTLSRWFRDYLYFPLGGSRKGELQTYLNLFIVFVLCGLWHGATWNFMIWGLFQGGFMMAERTSFGKWLEDRHVVLQHAYTMVIVLIGRVFFRSATVEESFRFLRAMVGQSSHNGLGYNPIARYLTPEFILIFLLAIVMSLPLKPWLERQLKGVVIRRPAFAIACSFVAMVGLYFLSVAGVAGSNYNPFIYFRF